ncbi:uncharacterized protein ACWYII_018338 isoform 1-T1 [Salvelinus alpinus]
MSYKCHLMKIIKGGVLPQLSFCPSWWLWWSWWSYSPGQMAPSMHWGAAKPSCTSSQQDRTSGRLSLYHGTPRTLLHLLPKDPSKRSDFGIPDGCNSLSARTANQQTSDLVGDRRTHRGQECTFYTWGLSSHSIKSCVRLRACTCVCPACQGECRWVGVTWCQKEGVRRLW